MNNVDKVDMLTEYFEDIGDHYTYPPTTFFRKGLLLCSIDETPFTDIQINTDMMVLVCENCGTLYVHAKT